MIKDLTFFSWFLNPGSVTETDESVTTVSKRRASALCLLPEGRDVHLESGLCDRSMSDGGGIVGLALLLQFTSRLPSPHFSCCLPVGVRRGKRSNYPLTLLATDVVSAP